MITNIYLTHLKTTSEDGKVYYWFTNTFLPTDMRGFLLFELLKLLGNIDISEMFDVSLFPPPLLIEQGERIYSLYQVGNVFEAPVDLYKLARVSFPIISAEMLPLPRPGVDYFIYSEIPAQDVTTDDLPIQMQDKIPTSGILWNPSFSPQNTIVRERYICTGRDSIFPAYVTPSLLWVYGGYEYEDILSENAEHVANTRTWNGTESTWYWVCDIIEDVFAPFEAGFLPVPPMLQTTRANAGLYVGVFGVNENTWQSVGGVSVRWSDDSDPAFSLARYYEPTQDSPVIEYNPFLTFLERPEIHNRRRSLFLGAILNEKQYDILGVRKKITLTAGNDILKDSHGAKILDEQGKEVIS